MRNKLLLLGIGGLICVAMASVAWADKLSEMNEKYWNPKPDGVLADINESEPNNDPATANAMNCGDVIHSAINPAGDVDYVVFTVPALTVITFGTDADGATPAGDTKIYLYDSNQAQVGYSDDDGPGLYSLITYGSAAGGTYYGKIVHYYTTSTGTYKAFVTCGAMTPPPVNDQCSGAIDIPCGPINLSGSTETAVNDYNPGVPGPSCTGWAAAGRDVTYKFLVGPGGAINVTYTSTVDASFYIVTDCSNVSGTCVVGADAANTTEVISYTFAAGGTYYLILDSYGTNNFGTWTLTGTLSGCPVGTNNRTWGSVKSMYR